MPAEMTTGESRLMVCGNRAGEESAMDLGNENLLQDNINYSPETLTR